MTITEKDFEENFLLRFIEEDKNAILSFCNSFLERFKGYLSKEQIISNIGKLNSIKKSDKLNENEGARLITTSTILENITTYDIEYNAKINFTEIEKKSLLYHELIHLLSHHTVELRDGKKRNFNGINYSSGMFDEIMTEFYAVEVLKQEGINLENKYYIETGSRINPEIFTKTEGTGYHKIAQLAELYNIILGNEIFKGKFENFAIFYNYFNKKFFQIDENPFVAVDNEIEVAYISNSEEKREKILKIYITALRLFEINENEYLETNALNLYEYLKKTNKIKNLLPTEEQRNCNFIGEIKQNIPIEMQEALAYIDEEIIIKKIKPEFYYEDTDIQERKKFLTVINVLRENIGNITEEDLKKFSYGEIHEYLHSNTACLVIKLPGKQYMASSDLTDNFYMGCTEFKVLENAKTFDVEEGTFATVNTVAGKKSLIAINEGYIPITHNNEIVSLQNEQFVVNEKRKVFR